MSMDGGTPGEAGGTRETTDEETDTTDPATRAYIHILRGMGLSYDQIVDEIGLESERPIKRALYESRERVADGDDPIEVWVDVVTPLYANDPEAGDGN